MNTFESWLKAAVQIIYKNRRLCSTIVFMRKFGVLLLGIILLCSLLGVALSVSSKIAFTNPQKIKTWLNESNLYGSFVTDAIKQAEATAGGGSDESGAVSLSDTAVQQIAQSTFSAQLLQKDVNTFVDSNYAWLEGKNDKPNFEIDLSNAKQTFAEKVGEYVQTYLTSLPVCSSAQLATTTQTADPLTLTCRPANLNAADEAQQVTETIANSTDFLSDPIITASNLNPKGDSQTEPYYQSLAGLPRVYQFGNQLPWIASLIAIASAIGVIFIPVRHRNGLRAVGIVLAIAGLTLIFTKFLSGQILDAAQRQIFNNDNVGELQKALTTFMGHIENQLLKVDFWFGVAYLSLAVIIFLVLFITRQRQQKTPKFLRNELGSQPTKSQPTAATASKPKTPHARSAADLRPPKPTAPVKTPSVPQPKPKTRRKPPKLIQ